MKSYKERKERKEAQKYFRQNNSEFLSAEQWIKTLIPGVLWAIVLGVIYGLLTNVIPFEFSVFYVVIGIAIANILNTASGVNTPQIGAAAAGCTLIALITATFTQLVSVFPIGIALSMTVSTFLSNGILDWIFVIIACGAAYLQGSENRFM